MHDGVPTLQRVLKDAGYTNGIIGKLHVAPFEAFPIDMDERRWKSSRDVRVITSYSIHYTKLYEKAVRAAHLPLHLAADQRHL